MAHQFTRALILAVLLTPAAASARTSHPGRSQPSGWRTYRSTALGVAFRYPPSWKLVTSVAGNGPGRQVSISAPLPARDSLSVTVLPIKAASALSTMIRRFTAYQSATGDTTFAHARWTSAALGKARALATVVVPATEGGAQVSQAIYVTQWRSRVYQIVLFSIHTPARSQLSQFRGVYGPILTSWRFI